MIHQRHRRTDRPTDGQTTCDRSTALCTKVHRAVKTKKETTKRCDKLGVRPAHPLIPILTKFFMRGGLPDVFLKLEFRDDRSINVGAMGVEICLLPLTRLIVYTTACCYRTSPDAWPCMLVWLTVRLVDGPSSSQGRLEVYYSGRWGTVCDDYFGDVDARVACRSLDGYR